MSAPHPDLPLEQQRNSEYLAKLKKWLEKPITYAVARNERWVNPNGNGHGKNYGVVHPLVGRVGLIKPDEDLGSSFYIGARRFDGDTQTVSCFAPIAAAFYRPDDPGHGLFGQIAAIRTFTHKVHDLVAVDEEVFAETPTSPFRVAALKVAAPTAPTARSTRRKLATPHVRPRTSPRTAPEPKSTAPGTGPAPAPAAATAPPKTRSTASDAQSSASATVGMRAAGAVLNRLAAPRSKELVSVLATLQPDQHDLVTRPADHDLIVQGHPGTGKTVVAAYRAGYLVTPNDPRRQEYGGGKRRVLLIGPTSGYVQHVSGLLAPFQGHGAGEITATDLGRFMGNIVGIKTPWSGGIDGEPSDVDANAFNLTYSAAELIRANPNLYKDGYSGASADSKRDLNLTYNVLHGNGIFADKAITTDATEIKWLRALPPFEEAMRLRRYLPLMAACRMAQWEGRQAPWLPSLARRSFDHIIVDEAQDVSPIEWSILEWYLQPGKSHWTLVGDQNQRRSNVSYTNWKAVAEHLQLNDGAGSEPQLMSRGYRSTNAILKFADGLLAPALRRAESIQDGGAPVMVVREPKSKRLYLRALSVATDLAKKYADGTVALITVYPDKLVDYALTEGWRRTNAEDFRTWQKDDVTVRIFSPERARGLEFDAVVVVEPRHYDNDNGRHGQLYTSLTRGNRELAVVYHQKLPTGLKAPNSSRPVTPC